MSDGIDACLDLMHLRLLLGLSDFPGIGCCVGWSDFDGRPSCGMRTGGSSL